MFNAASKLYFSAAAVAIVVGFGYVVVSSDRVGFTNLVVAGLVAVGLGLAAFAYVPREPLSLVGDEPAEARPADTTDVAVPSNWPVFGALALGLLAAGAALDGSLILLGIIVGLIAAFAWFGQVWREHPSWSQDMTDRINNRFVVPFGLPGTIFLAVGVGVISLSRLLLAVPATVAPYIGIVIAFSLLGGFYLISMRRLGRQAMATIATVAVGLVLAAGVAGALKGERRFGEEGGEREYALAAEDISFDKEELDFPSNTEVTLEFTNREAIPHNFSLYADRGGDRLFEGEIVNTTGDTRYDFKTPEAGEYWFQCDVHPDQMNGLVHVSKEASEPKSGDDDGTTTGRTSGP
ncbi:MAG TPA: cupredoxin domain-containing protein [Acidimicrobiales bacterium]|nr:cupredoxin domain-containing protein [Acidimicrobiales bacterium]